MKEIMFPELSEKKQQSIYGAWGGSRSDQDYREDIPNYDLDNIIIPSDGGGGYTVPNEWLNEIIVTPDGGYANDNSGGNWGDDWSNGWGNGDFGGGDFGGGDFGGGNFGGGNFGGGSSSGDSDYNISNDSFIDFASGEASDATNNEIAEKIRAAAAGLAAGAAGTMLEGLDKTIQKIGFTPTKLASVGKGLGVASVVIGGTELVIAAAEVASGERDWNDTDTLNTIATALGATAVFFPGPQSIIFGGLSIMVGLVGAAYTSQNHSMNYDY